MRAHRSLLLFILLVVSAPSGIGQQLGQQPARFQHRLMPLPSEFRFSSGRLRVDSSLKIAVKGYRDERLEAAIQRVARRLEGRTGLEIDRKLGNGTANSTLLIVCDGPGQNVPSVEEDESYSLDVNPAQATLKAHTVVGVLRGLETFLQLLDGSREGYFIPAVSINDKPRFRWRGLLIDVARHFQPIEVLKRNIDGMAAVKLNVFHWHLTEDQGFRVESRKFPRLHQLGSDGQYYTQEQLREIIAYARDRGIRVVPEFDMPGHVTSWLVGHPELGSAPGPYEIERKPGIMEPALDPTREEVYTFLETLIGEMAGIFPDAYMHIGGDENEGKQWDRNPRIQAFMQQKGIKDNHGLQSYFNQRLLQILKKNGKRMIGWDEIFHPDLPKDVVVQSWRGPDSLAETARKGYNGILSNGYYIDLIYPASKHYVVDPIPAGSSLSEQEKSHILGGEATMWSEYVSPETIDSRIWPRTAAIAERFWSPAETVNLDEMYRRLETVSIQLEELGLTHLKNPGMMLRRLAGGADIAPLEVLVSVVEPVKEYNRGQLQPTTTLSPLIRLVDIARPDPETPRRFVMLVDGILADAPRFQLYQERIRDTLSEWRDVRTPIEIISARSAILQEAVPLAKDLSDIGNIGLEALSFLSSGVAPPPEWRDAKMAVLTEFGKPKTALEFPILPAVKQLVTAAAELPQLKGMTSTEWRERVRLLAVEK